MPAISRPSVDLPAPDGPTMASRSPGTRSRETPLSTSRPDRYAYRTSSTSSRPSRGVSPLAVRSGGHVGDPDDPGERGGADLDLVEPHEQLVEGHGQRLDVERDRGDGADGRLALRHQPAAPEQRDGDGEQVGDLDLREPPHPQAQGVHLRVVGVADGVVDPGPPPTTQAQRVHGARAVDRLGDDAVHHRVGGPFAQVAGRRVPEVPPRREPQQREPDDDGQGHHASR